MWSPRTIRARAGHNWFISGFEGGPKQVLWPGVGWSTNWPLPLHLLGVQLALSSLSWWVVCVVLWANPCFTLCWYSWCEASKLVNSYGWIWTHWRNDSIFQHFIYLSCCSSGLSNQIQCSQILWPGDCLFTYLFLKRDFKRGIIKMGNSRDCFPRPAFNEDQ